MRFKKITSIFEYTTGLLKKINEIKQTQENIIYRIIETKLLPSGLYKIVIQIIGKSSVIECSPQEIVLVDRLLEGFSKKDIRTITYLACDQINKPKYKIVVQNFCNELNRMVFRLKESESKTLLAKTANQIVLDKDLINNLSKEDINSISYIAGYESGQNTIN